MLVDVPMNTSPLAPTYFGSEEVDILRSMVVDLVHDDEFSPFDVSLAATVLSFCYFSSLLIEKPTPCNEIAILKPSFIVVEASTS